MLFDDEDDDADVEEDICPSSGPRDEGEAVDDADEARDNAGIDNGG